MVFLLDHTPFWPWVFLSITTNYAVATWKSDLTFSDKELGDFLVGKCSLGKSQDPRLSPNPFFCRSSHYS